jgi:serine/threonine-protein kinase PRP4
LETLEHDEVLQDDATQRDVMNSNPETLGDASEKQPVDQIESNQAPSPSADGDMFADTPEDDAVNNERKQVSTKGLKDNYDDAEGYYNFQVGEVIGSRYEVFATHGRGVFSSVLRARDLRDYKNDQDKDSCPQVAVKVIRANDTMYKAGQTEKVILNKLLQADPEGKKHCIRMLNSFEYRNHLCLVFEPMAMNLRDLTKKYGRGIGLSLNAVRVYATQMFIALLHLKTCGVLHADIKPDNILINERRTVIKICDFGSAMFSGDNEITPYLVSRFYRAPEVILGLPYDYPMDMWSIGCVIFELCTGQILFKGRSNNEMLKYMMDVKGPFPKKMLKKAEFAFRHFDLKDATMSFALEEQDPVTKQPIRRIISNPTKKEGLSKLLMNESDNKKKLLQLVDLLERIFVLEPEKRITPLDALKHPFIVSEATPKNPHLSQAPRSLKQQKS